MRVCIAGVFIEVYCNKNKISELKPYNLPNLKTFNCSGNTIIELDLHGCSSLTNLTYGNEVMTKLNINNYVALERILSLSSIVELTAEECAFLHTMT